MHASALHMAHLYPYVISFIYFLFMHPPSPSARAQRSQTVEVEVLSQMEKWDLNLDPQQPENKMLCEVVSSSDNGVMAWA